jgi:hypothetical protein
MKRDKITPLFGGKVTRRLRTKFIFADGREVVVPSVEYKIEFPPINVKTEIIREIGVKAVVDLTPKRRRTKRGKLIEMPKRRAS